jgi:hypothetical protein
MRTELLSAVFVMSLLGRSAMAAGPASFSPGLEALDAAYPALDALYRDLHQNPELSLHEEKTAAKLAAKLKALGFDVTEHVGGTGIVGVLRNGEGPTVLVRTDLDALPVKEATGLPYASTATFKDTAGTEPVSAREPRATGRGGHLPGRLPSRRRCRPGGPWR